MTHWTKPSHYTAKAHNEAVMRELGLSSGQRRLVRPMRRFDGPTPARHSTIYGGKGGGKTHRLNVEGISFPVSDFRPPQLKRRWILD